MTALGLVGREKGGRSEKGEVNRKEYVCVLQMAPVTKEFIVPFWCQGFSSPNTSLQATNASHTASATVNSSCGNTASNFSNINPGNTNMI